ncbi:MAG: nucleoside kinase [Clostridia bacterium]|nr:nucleoside kinase [Clostridia bacterium]
MQYFSIKEMNDASVNPAAFIAKCDAAYDAMIREAAETILAAGEEKPLVLLSGGSGCGKTTTAHRIEQYLDEHGHETHVLSMDNYYYRPSDRPCPVDEEGKIDLESPLLLDAELLSDHLQKIIRCEPIEMPIFDFVNECRSDKVIPFHRKPGERVIMEGIHALNPEVVGAAHGMSTKIYISVRTRVQDSAGYVLHPSRIRVMRRLLRDQRHRGQSFADTIDRLRSVNRGERLYILPNKHYADIQLDTFVPYELAVYRNDVLAGMADVDRTFAEDRDVEDIVPMLRQVSPIDPALVPKSALIQEFIGEE